MPNVILWELTQKYKNYDGGDEMGMVEKMVKICNNEEDKTSIPEDHFEYARIVYAQPFLSERPLASEAPEFIDEIDSALNQLNENLRRLRIHPSEKSPRIRASEQDDPRLN
ncbi:hypothetical protein PtB15_17B17 [Puccinia triticina]|nr:hypothetical protein PtB15_17B17 [Puccinia triticina]